MNNSLYINSQHSWQVCEIFECIFGKHNIDSLQVKSHAQNWITKFLTFSLLFGFCYPYFVDYFVADASQVL
jgi:hypothetical protein